MLSKDHVISDYLDPLNITTLIHQQHYEEAATLQQQAQYASQQADDLSLAQLFAVAQQICVALARCYADAQHYDRASKVAHDHEADLQAQMKALLNLGQNSHDSHTPAPARDSLAQPPPPPKRTSPLQYMRNLLKPASVPAHDTVNGSSSIDSKHRIMVYSLGTFQVYRGDELIENWNGRKSALLFKYLVLHHNQPMRREALMEQFWPDTDEESQRNSLNVAIYGLRQALRNGDANFSSVMFSQGCYAFSPDLYLWVDYEEFLAHVNGGKKLEQQRQAQSAMQEYLQAEMLYQGAFLAEDLCEDWLAFHRQSLQDNYLSILHSLSGYYHERGDFAACVTTCKKMLEVDPCLEEAHRQLMACYDAQGQSFLAQRQYHLCKDTLERELEITPSGETTRLYHQIRD